jgi:4,5-DOPA dioxygenase extradiol
VAEHPDYALAVPTPDHFIPMLHIAGLAAADGALVEPLLRGYSLGSISMTCYQTGAPDRSASRPEGSAVLPVDVPPDQTNT